jgi:hypothetical protein
VSSPVRPLREAPQARDHRERDASPAPALRVAAPPPTGPAARRAPAPDAFWRDYHRRRSMNHVALMLTARAVQAALDAGEAVDAGTRRRLRAALDDYETAQRLLRERVGEVAADVPRGVAR